MKKGLWTKITAVALSLALFLLTGCNKEKQVNEPEFQESEKIEVRHPLVMPEENQMIRMDDVSGWKEGVERLGFADAELIYQTKDGKGYVVSVDVDAPNDREVNMYAFYEDTDAVYVDTVFEYACFDKYEICEIDGDSEFEEIAIYFGFIGSGAVSEVQVWTFKYDMPARIFTTASDFGYYSIPKDGYEIVIDNIYTGYQTIFDCKDNRASEYIFDEKGKIKSYEGADFRYEHGTTIKDIDSDGLSEIVCKERVCISFNANYIGSTVTTIDYDTNMQNFVVVEAEFVESLDGNLV